jgi:soluble lytic murein transglycosylase-like protein
VLAAVRGTSAANGANFDMLLSYAAMESGLNPTARATTSSASGLYQFTEQTWLNAVREYGAAHGMGAEAALVTRQGGQLAVRPSWRPSICAVWRTN